MGPPLWKYIWSHIAVACRISQTPGCPRGEQSRSSDCRFALLQAQATLKKCSSLFLAARGHGEDQKPPLSNPIGNRCPNASGNGTSMLPKAVAHVRRGLSLEMSSWALFVLRARAAPKQVLIPKLLRTPNQPPWYLRSPRHAVHPGRACISAQRNVHVRVWAVRVWQSVIHGFSPVESARGLGCRKRLRTLGAGTDVLS